MLLRRPRLLPLIVVAVASLAVLGSPAHGFSIPPETYGPPFKDPSARPDTPMRTTFAARGTHTTVVSSWYRAWNGRVRTLRILYPRRHPRAKRLPLVVWLHGAGGAARCENSFRYLPGRFRFAVACIDGQGTATRGYSYGAPGQIADVGRVPGLVRERVPFLRIDPRRVIIAGTSMGGMEALLAADRFPRLFSGVVALDAPSDMRIRHDELAPIRRRAIEAECGGNPTTAPACFAARSPIANLRGVARSRMRLGLYWSTRDRTAGAEGQLPAYAEALRAANPRRTFLIRVGNWRHSRAWGVRSRDFEWLIDQGLMPERLRDRGRNTSGWWMQVRPQSVIRALPIAR
jgi:acetyl esterase/lipase